MPRASRTWRCLLPVLACHRQSEEGAQRPRLQGRGRGSTSPLTSRSPAPSVSHVSHAKPRWLREQASGRAPHPTPPPPRTQGQWSAQSIARLPPLRSQPACRQDRVVASGAEAVLGQQVGESHGSIEDRLYQMEAQLEEKNKELQRVPVLMGRQRLGGR